MLYDLNNLYLIEIERFIMFLKNLKPAQLAKLDMGDAQISFFFDEIACCDVFQENHADNSLVTESILESISQLESKADFDQYFKSLGLKRKDLEALCRAKDIPYTKRDNMSALKDKLYERLVGFKLRSRAIQNDNQ